jgi:hypothetical protein
MNLRIYAMTVIWLPIVLVACGSGNEDKPEISDSNEPQELVSGTEIFEEGKTADQEDQSTTLWALRGELTYGDEYGVTSVEILDSVFTVGSDGELDGAGLAVFLHEGPCLGAKDEYGFEISGHFDEATNMFIIDDSFSLNGEEDTDSSDSIITYDRTFESCTVGQTLGESTAMLRPVIFLAAEGGNENIQAGEIHIPAVSNERVVLNINGGLEGIESTGMGGYVFFEVVQMGD